VQQEAGASSQAALTLANLGATAIERDDYDAAAELLTESAAALRSAGDGSVLATILAGLSYVEHERGKGSEATSLWREALQLAADFDAWPAAAWTLVVAAAVEAEQRPVAAAWWLGAGEAAYERLGVVWDPLERRVQERGLAALGRVLDDDELRVARAAGVMADLRDAALRALQLEPAGRVV
jgi:hypothetical protein